MLLRQKLAATDVTAARRSGTVVSKDTVGILAVRIAAGRCAGFVA